MFKRRFNDYTIEDGIVNLKCADKEGVIYSVLLDEKDFDKVYNHYGLWGVSTAPSGKLVAKASILNRSDKRCVPLHRVVLGEDSRYSVLHKNGNTLDYTRSNLTKLPHSARGIHSTTKRSTKSGCTGVTWSKQMERWVVRIGVDNRYKHIGYFTDLEKAIQARKLAEKEYWGIPQQDISMV